MRAILRVAGKDLRAEARGKEALTAVLVLAFFTAVVGAFGLMGAARGAAGAATVLWIAVAFVTMLGVARGMAAEVDRGTWDALLLLPVDRGELLAGKTLANAVLVLLAAAVVLPVHQAFGGAGVPLASVGPLALVLLVAIVGFSAAATTLAAVALQARGREALLPVLLAPIVLPILFPAIQATVKILEKASLPSIRSELTFMAGYDIALLALAWLLFERAVEG